MATKPPFEDKDVYRGNAAASDGSPGPDGSKEDVAYADTEYSNLSFWTRMGCTPESFKRRTKADKHNQLNQTLKPRHLHMIAIGGSIGAGLFVGSGSALNNGGPASLLLDFAIIGFVCCCTWLPPMLQRKGC
jgi:yeast amino acid transporter